ncbi:MAG: PAS domain S-box protein, partial [Anaerolineales bacterium]|nr:PAS domain S-box protein [Anaerolineales bacterium]
RARKLDEERRRQELELSRQIITQLPDAVVVTDSQQRIARWLGNAEMVFGYAESDAVGQPVRLLFPSEAPLGQERVVAEQIARLKQFTDYFQVRRQDGRLIDVEANVREWQAGDGETDIRHVGVFRDITRRLQMNAALQRSLDSYQQLISSAVFPIMIVVAEEIRFVNEASLQLLGLGQLSELIGQPLAHWLQPHDQATTLAALEQITQGEAVPAVSCGMRRADGQHLAVEISGIYMDMDGSQAALLFLQDVTERLQVERQRSQAEATMRRRNQELTLLNDLGRQIGRHLREQEFLQTLYEEVGRHIFQADFFALLEVDQRDHSLSYVGAWLGHRPVTIPTAEFPFNQTPFLNTVMTGQPETLPWLAEYANLHPDLAAYFGATQGATLIVPILAGTAVTSIVWAISRDPDAFTDMNVTWLSTLAGQIGVTLENVALYAQAQREIEERRKVESALAAEREQLAQRVTERTAELVQANADLQRAAQHREEFMASVSHELRTPLTGILGMAEALQRQTHGQLTPRQLRSVQQIESSGRHLLTLINDLLDLSRINAGHLKLSIEKADVRGVSEASIAMVSALASEKSLTLCAQIDPAIRTMQADSRRLVQILVNLLSNAIKFSRAEGRVGLDVTLLPEQEQICFAIWDEGIGIAADDLEEIFQPFYQLDQGLDRQYGGSGLGLALVQRLVDLHGGRVWAESALGQGSRFLVELPLRQGETAVHS